MREETEGKEDRWEEQKNRERVKQRIRLAPKGHHDSRLQRALHNTRIVTDVRTAVLTH